MATLEGEEEADAGQVEPDDGLHPTALSLGAHELVQGHLYVALFRVFSLSIFLCHLPGASPVFFSSLAACTLPCKRFLSVSEGRVHVGYRTCLRPIGAAVFRAHSALRTFNGQEVTFSMPFTYERAQVTLPGRERTASVGTVVVLARPHYEDMSVAPKFLAVVVRINRPLDDYQSTTVDYLELLRVRDVRHAVEHARHTVRSPAACVSSCLRIISWLTHIFRQNPEGAGRV